jgi:transcriptional regulator with XRE-family HTH domain
MTLLIKLIRQRHLLTQTQFAELMGVSRTTIAAYEAGLVSPRNTIIKKLLELAKDKGIDCHAEDFFKE